MNNFVVGLTGGIGSGKTTVANLFHSLFNINIVDADACSRNVVEKGKPALEKIVQHFGESILLKNGSLNRAKLRSIIFQRDEERKWLENLLHPLIYEEITSQLAAASSPYTILVSPLLIETSQKNICDRILVIDVSEAEQIQRTMSRDNNSRELVEAILKTQLSRTERKKAADDIIDNNQSTDALEKQVHTHHSHYMQLSSTHNPS